MTDYTQQFQIGDTVTACQTGVISSITSVSIGFADGSFFETTDGKFDFTFVSRPKPQVGSRWMLNGSSFIFTDQGTYFCYSGPSVGVIAADIDYHDSATAINV